ncbi:unnamed protein product [Moneuplotes crassus]|uniref:Uncharacterized protein n=1 Tax=Euplotes crassus TaxID=5936 RepID=A0AAD2CZB2_EUPCR|nr:unnamed protein product [Moneuplotes crassus]
MKPFKSTQKDDSKSTSSREMPLEEQNLFQSTFDAGNIMTSPTSPDPYSFVYGQQRGLFPLEQISKPIGAIKPKPMYKGVYDPRFLPQGQFVYLNDLAAFGYVDPNQLQQASAPSKQRGISEDVLNDTSKELIYRSDVIQKGWFRNALSGIIIPHARGACKGAKKPDKFYRKLLNMLKDDVKEFLQRDCEFQAKLIGPLAKDILRKNFETTTQESTLFSDEMKNMIIDCGNLFKKEMKNFSFVPEREKAYKHPIFGLAKRLMENNEIYFKKFWERFEDRRNKVGSFEKFKRRVDREMQGIIDLDDPSTFAHF